MKCTHYAIIPQVKKQNTASTPVTPLPAPQR